MLSGGGVKCDLDNGILRVVLQMAKKDYDIEECRRAVSENPGDVDALNSLGISYWAAGEDEAAAEVFAMVVEIDAELAGAWYNLGCVYKNTGQEEKVKEVFSELENLDEELAAEFSKEVMR